MINWEGSTYRKVINQKYLEFSASIELAETLDSLLSVHHGCHCRTMLWEHKTRIIHIKKYQRVHEFTCAVLWLLIILLRDYLFTPTVSAPSLIMLQFNWILTQTHGCLRACSAVILLAGLIVNIWLIRFFASGVTVSHSGEGNWGKEGETSPEALSKEGFIKGNQTWLKILERYYTDTSSIFKQVQLPSIQPYLDNMDDMDRHLPEGLVRSLHLHDSG